ncbi:unnamed protein product [Symbiodinium sp. KB8]|nr:unnamed protein product [Symbiodinium sp. KB8]
MSTGVQPDISSHNAIANVCSRIVEVGWQRALCTLKEGESNLLDLDCVSLNTLAGMLDWSFSIACVSRMRHLGLVPDAVSWTSATAAAARSSGWHRATTIARAGAEHIEAKTGPSPYAAASIPGYARNGRWEDAVLVADEICREGDGVSDAVVNGAISERGEDTRRTRNPKYVGTLGLGCFHVQCVDLKLYRGCSLAGLPRQFLDSLLGGPTVKVKVWQTNRTYFHSVLMLAFTDEVTSKEREGGFVPNGDRSLKGLVWQLLQDMGAALLWVAAMDLLDAGGPWPPAAGDETWNANCWADESASIPAAGTMTKESVRVHVSIARWTCAGKRVVRGVKGDSGSEVENGTVAISIVLEVMQLREVAEEEPKILFKNLCGAVTEGLGFMA